LLTPRYGPRGAVSERSKTVGTTVPDGYVHPPLALLATFGPPQKGSLSFRIMQEMGFFLKGQDGPWKGQEGSGGVRGVQNGQIGVGRPNSTPPPTKTVTTPFWDTGGSRMALLCLLGVNIRDFVHSFS